MFRTPPPNTRHWRDWGFTDKPVTTHPHFPATSSHWVSKSSSEQLSNLTYSWLSYTYSLTTCPTKRSLPHRVNTYRIIIVLQLWWVQQIVKLMHLLSWSYGESSLQLQLPPLSILIIHFKNSLNKGVSLSLDNRTILGRQLDLFHLLPWVQFDGGDVLRRIWIVCKKKSAARVKEAGMGEE